MPSLDIGLATLIAITLFAAFVNGALGYGFSSLTVPIGLLFYSNRILNPALVLIEVFINLYVLIVNRGGVRAVWGRVYPILLGLLPGVALGAYILSWVQPGWLKLATYSLLLPLILFQAGGIRRPIRAERLIGLPFGAGLGLLYSVTTISGPPLAVLFNNQGLVKQDFRAALGLIRVTESILTAIAYYYLGLFAAESIALLPILAPGVLLGIPLGAMVIRRVDAETFRRVCMSFDVWIVSFGLCNVLLDLRIAVAPHVWALMAAAVLLDFYLLYVFFTRRNRPS